MLVFHFERRSPVPEESQAGFTRCADPVIPSMKTRNNNTQFFFKLHLVNDDWDSMVFMNHACE